MALLHRRAPVQAAGSALHTCAGLLGFATAWEGEYKRGLEEDHRRSLSRIFGLGQCCAARWRTRACARGRGFSRQASVVFDAIRQLGRTTRDLRHLIFTHGHPDHIGSAAAIVRETGATTYRHALDAPFAKTGGPFRPMNPAPGLLSRAAYRFVWRPQKRMEPVRIDRHMADGEMLPIAGGLHVVHIPGHCAGQVAFLWQGERLLIAGDVGTNILALGDPVGFEDIEEGRRSQRKVATLRFNAAVFGHGRPIHSGASKRIRSKWGR
jgi:glyoxylase-like metal-dependent hydrolase (beta-lactamase superfamily II)